MGPGGGGGTWFRKFLIFSLAHPEKPQEKNSIFIFFFFFYCFLLIS